MYSDILTFHNLFFRNFDTSTFCVHTFPESAMIYPRALMMITKIHIWLIENLYPRFGWISHEIFFVREIHFFLNFTAPARLNRTRLQNNCGSLFEVGCMLLGIFIFF